MSKKIVETFIISNDIREKLEKLDNAGYIEREVLTEEQKQIILEYFPKKNKKQLAEFLNISLTSLKKYYKKLKEERCLE